MLSQITLLICLRDKLLTMELTLDVHCIISLEWPSKKTPLKTFLNAKLVNLKRSYSKQTLLNTAANLQLIFSISNKYFGTILPRPYIRQTLLDLLFLFLFLFFLPSLYLFFFSCHYYSFIIFSPSFTFDADTYRRNCLFCLIVRWIMSATCLGIAAKICFQCLANLS